MNIDQPYRRASKNVCKPNPQSARASSIESLLASLALLLGPETDYAARVRATRRLTRGGEALLPVVLNALNNYPEITAPAWPWWPPQYQHCSRLLINLCREAQIRLDALLQHPAVVEPIGPVLWISVIEASALLPHTDHETLLCQGLMSHWVTVRYAAAMALATVGASNMLRSSTIAMLRSCQDKKEDISVRLASAYALLRINDSCGIEALMKLLTEHEGEEARKAAIFILATEPIRVIPWQRERLVTLLIQGLQDQNAEIAMHAARALSHFASPSALPALCSLLASPGEPVQIATLSALEELAGKNHLRRALQQHTMLIHIVNLLRSSFDEVRRQASYTLAAIGGEYVLAVFGTLLHTCDHMGHLEAIEGLRLFRGALQVKSRTTIIRWLLHCMEQRQEEVQITALDSLAYLVWQARAHGYKKAHIELSQEIWQHGNIDQLLTGPHAWVRQRTIELVALLHSIPPLIYAQLLLLLRSDKDAGVRACIAYTLGKIGERQAIPDLLEALLDTDEYVAETALNALGQLATLDDVIVVYVIRELACSIEAEQEGSRLAHVAQTLLKKWRQAEKKAASLTYSP